jgi:hypothetical protein
VSAADASCLALDERAQIVKQARLPNLLRSDEGAEPRCLLFVERDSLTPSTALWISASSAHRSRHLFSARRRLAVVVPFLREEER